MQKKLNGQKTMPSETILSNEGKQYTRAVDPTRPNWMEVDLGALEHNFKLVKSKLGPDVRIHPSVKSAAYGLGLLVTAQKFVELGADAISCGAFQDARALRNAGLEDIDIVMFGGTLPSGIPDLLAHKLIPTVHNIELADAVSATGGRRSRVYVKIDTGWGRLGFPAQYARESINKIARLPNIEIAGVYTHLPFTNMAGAEWAAERVQVFDEIIQNLRRDGIEIPVTQTRSSAGILMGIQDNCNSVAPGSILYGKQVLPRELYDFREFKRVLVGIKSRIIHINTTAYKQSVGAPSRFSGQVRGTTGVIPYGRRDGNRASYKKNQSFMIVNGAPAPVLSISSEQCVLDLSDVPEPKVGDEVIILGEENGHRIDLETLATWQGSGMNDVLLMHRDRMECRMVN